MVGRRTEAQRHRGRQGRLMLWLIGGIVAVGLVGMAVVRWWEREVMDLWWELRSMDGE